MASDTPGKKTGTGDDPEYVDYQLMYNYTKQVETQMEELKSESTTLRNHLVMIKTSLTTEMAAVLRKVLSNYFNGFEVLLSPTPM